MSQDPLNQVGGARTFWTTVNATEAIPGATTPLTWSFYSDATELALRGTFAEIGTLPRSEVTGANLAADPDGRFIGIFLGHPAANMNVFRRMTDLTPGGFRRCARGAVLRLHADAPGAIGITGEVVHSTAFMMSELNDLAVGTDHGRPGTKVIVEAPTRYEWDGEVGWGWVERSRVLGDIT
jgi:hypothetical protein